MNWKNRLTNYNFWISLVSAVLLILQAFNFEFDIANLSEIATALLGLLVVIGIISNPTKTNSESKKDETKSSQKESEKSAENKPVEDKENTLKETLDGMPSGEQDAYNSGAGEDDFEVLIDKISADIATQMGAKKENIVSVVNEIVKTYEEGDFMLDTQDINLEDIAEKTIDNSSIEVETEEPIEKINTSDETVEQVEENIVDEIAEELLEKDEVEISNELAESVNEEYLEYKQNIEEINEVFEEGETQDLNIVEVETISQDEIGEVLVEEQIEERIEEEKIETIDETSHNKTNNQPTEEDNVISFKIVN